MARNPLSGLLFYRLGKTKFVFINNSRLKEGLNFITDTNTYNTSYSDEGVQLIGYDPLINWSEEE